MIKSTLRIFPFLILILSLGSMSCTNTNKTTKTASTSKNADKLDEAPIQLTAQNLYLMLRLERNDSTGVIDVLTIEKQVYDKQGNALPVNADITGDQLFTCEIKQQNGEVIRKAEQKVDFNLGNSDNEAILKFIIQIPEEAYYVEVNHLTDKGVWEKVYSTKL